MNLDQHSFIISIPEPHRSEILPEIEILPFQPDETIFAEQTQPDSMYLILEGTVSFGKQREDGVRQIVSHATVDGFFGEVGVFTGETRALDAKADTVASIARIPKATFNKITQEAAPIKKILESIIGHLNSTTTHYMSDLVRNEKLSLVGTMMASILHDFRNPFSIISLGAHFIGNRHTDDVKTKKICKNIDAQISRMVDMANDLSAFARGDEAVHLSDITAQKFIDEFRDLNEPFFNDPNIPITTELEEITLRIDTGKISRSLQNLINNAREAIESSGLRGEIEIRCIRNGNQNLIEITDSGPGIPLAIQDRFFEPFVTSGKANGTGLGSAIVRSNIKAHGGDIEFQTKPGKTTFRISLPIAS